MIYCFDTYYYDTHAKTSCVGISTWASDSIAFELSETITGVMEYESGSFYKRELPCIISMLTKIDLIEGQDMIVIDGFVVLDGAGKAGLGGYLFDHLHAKIPIVGVAKNNFATINKLKREICRGESKKPLYVTAMGMDLDEAGANISAMHGEFRIPTVLKLVDSHCRIR